MTANTKGIKNITNTILKRLENWIAVHRILFLLLLIAFIILLFLIVWIAHPTAAPPWTGFGEVKTAGGEVTRTPRTLWDWLELLIVPAFLAGAAAWIVRSQRAREAAQNKFHRELAEQARTANLETAEKSRETARAIARARQDQLILGTYYDRMADLLLNHDLRSKTAVDDEERTIARTSTLAVLHSLDGSGKGQIISYLYESDLIAIPDPVLNLQRADLSGANLVRAHLEQANLNKANLCGALLSGALLDRAHLLETDLSSCVLFEASLRQAKLNHANLHGASLKFATLVEADLEGANLIDADLHSAHLRNTNLSQANLNDANLSRARLNRAYQNNATLKRANLSQANLSHAYLLKTNLSSSQLDETDLFNADLSGANLRGANLSGAILKEANLTHAYLSAADLTLADLSGAIYNSQTIWPDGFDPTAAGAIFIEDPTTATIETDEEE